MVLLIGIIISGNFMSDSNYKSLSSLTEKINQQIGDLVSGKLMATELEDLLQDVGQLQERLVILRYKAFEVEVKSNKTTAQKAADHESYLANQISLIDAIQEVEKERVEPVEELPKAAPMPAFELQMKKPAAVPEPVIEATPQPIAPPIEEKSTVSIPAPEPEKTPEVVVTAPPVSNKQETEDEVTLNQRLRKDEPVSLAQRLQKSPIPDLTKHIGIAQRFVFINELFDKNADDYSKSIEKLNTFNNLDEAKTFIRKNILPHYNWDTEDSQVQKFYELVERRYLA